jgi:hypothetical protein
MENESDGSKSFLELRKRNQNLFLNKPPINNSSFILFVEITISLSHSFHTSDPITKGNEIIAG